MSGHWPWRPSRVLRDHLLLPVATAREAEQSIAIVTSRLLRQYVELVDLRRVVGWAVVAGTALAVLAAR